MKNLMRGRDGARIGSILTVVGAFLVAAHPCAADQIWQSSSQLWGQQDRCARQAFKKFPDYTRESNAKREHEFRLCLAGGNLPPHGPESVPPATPTAATPAGNDDGR